MYRRSRLATSARRFLLLFLGDPVALERSTDAELERELSNTFKLEGSSAMGSELVLGLTQLGGGLLFLALDYWLWNWFWHPVRYLLVFMGGSALSLEYFYCIRSQTLGSHKNGSRPVFFGLVFYALSRAALYQ